MNNQAEYKATCPIDMPLFQQPFWLDIVAENQWDVLLIKENNTIAASMPLIYNSLEQRTKIIKPFLTPFCGPYFNKEITKNDFVKEQNLLMKLEEQINDYKYFEQNWHNSITNWLPFYWKNYSQRTKYTYILNDIKNIDQFYGNFKTNIKRNIKKSKEKFNIQIKQSTDIDIFYEVLCKTFKKKGMSHHIPKFFYERIIKETSKRNCGTFLFAKDDMNKIHAVSLIVWDADTAYYLAGGNDPELNKSGSASHLMVEAIKYASQYVNKFDFEGSMLKSIENYFRGFGAKQIPYFEIIKVNSRVMKMKFALKEIFKTLKK